MSIRIISQVWEFSTHSGSALLMLQAIADFADDDGKAFPSVSTLAIKCRMTARNANLLIAKLKKSGELTVLQNKGRSGSNLYQITLKTTSSLKSASCIPEGLFPTPLKRASDKPSVNRQEPSGIAEARLLKGSRLPPDWLLPESYRLWACDEQGWSIDWCNLVSKRFHDYWLSVPGSKGTKADWFATWRNWCRQEKANKPSKNVSRFENFDNREYSSGKL